MIIVEAVRVQQWDEKGISPQTWHQLKTTSVCRETIAVCRKDGEVLRANTLGQQFFVEGRAPSQNIFPHIVDPSVVSAALRKVGEQQRFQSMATVQTLSGEKQRVLLAFEPTIHPITQETLILYSHQVIKDRKKRQLEIKNLLQLSNDMVHSFMYMDGESGSLPYLLRTINRLMVLQVESGRMGIARTEFDLYDTVEDSVQFVATSTPHVILCHLSNHLHNKLIGDPLKIKQVLLNLIVNAIQHGQTNHGHVLVRVTLQSETSRHLSIKIQVEDQGKGLTKDEMVDLFPQFSVTCQQYQMHDQVGLGLPLSKQLVELMGGSIGAHSGQGSGALFWVKLTLEKVVDVGQPACLYKSYPSNVVGQSVILIAGDPQDPHLAILTEYLSQWTLKTVFASTAAEARQILKTNRIQFAFIATLKDCDSNTFHNEIDRNGAYGHVHAIVIGAASPSSSQGRSPHLATPIRMSTLHSTLNRMINQRRRSHPTLHDDQTATSEDAVQSGDGTSLDELPSGPAIDIKVLIVEDNPLAQKFGRKILEKCGLLQVEVASNGDQALSMFGKGRYDMILMDCEMPLMDGYCATRRLREIERETGGHVIVVAVTAMNMQEDKDRSFQAGMDDFISKPVTNKDMMEKLQRWSHQIAVTKSEQSFGAFSSVAPLRRSSLTPLSSDVMHPRIEGFVSPTRILKSASLHTLPIIE
eukprot:TRINITY_DN4515_c0_g1_i5.p1 TRINITY_DN4515_c0_g1~~TRINITY_DN4515_c0_g1_i5.p1  ORF type:complete len:696 (-),score=149.96 TRINITY_DN4515_c0_g1_i5:13-2100(-)